MATLPLQQCEADTRTEGDRTAVDPEFIYTQQSTRDYLVNRVS